MHGILGVEIGKEAREVRDSRRGLRVFCTVPIKFWLNIV